MLERSLYCNQPINNNTGIQERVFQKADVEQLSFAPEFKFAGGTAPTITAASGSTDILTFQSYDASSLFGTAVQNLS